MSEIDVGPALLAEARELHRQGWPAPAAGSVTATARARYRRDPVARRALAEALAMDVRGNRAVGAACVWCAARVSFLLECGNERWAECSRPECGWFAELEVLIWWPLRRGQPARSTVADPRACGTMEREGPGSATNARPGPAPRPMEGAKMHTYRSTRSAGGKR